MINPAQYSEDMEAEDLEAEDLEAEDLAATFSALGDTRRLDIIKQLQITDDQSVTSLSKGMEVSRQAVSKHLKKLADAGLVTVVKTGRETLYSLERQQLQEANAFLILIGKKWDHALGRLKSHVEGSNDCSDIKS